MAARTTSGCWTCRIRRKKCDDVQPLCGPCNIRQLTCHGYGPKPAWMDGAENQKAEVERIKQSVSENFRSRRAFRVTKKQAGPSRVIQATKLTSEVGSSQQEDDLDQNASNFDQLRIDDWRGTAVSLPLVEPWPTTGNSPESLLQHGSDDTSKTTTGTPGSLQTVSSQGSKRVADSFSFHPDAAPADDEHDFAMIMNYLDKVFPLQFYFYQPSSLERGRGWLLSLLLRAKSAYFTALSLSCLQQIKYVYQDDIKMKQALTIDLDVYHSRAVSELKKQLDYLPAISGSEHLKTGVEILACMLQLLSIEVFRETKGYEGWKGDWEVHLQAAGDLLKVIGTDLDTTSNSSGSSSGGESVQRHSEAGPTTTLLPLGEIAGLDFFMTVYIWADIFRCASIGGTSPVREPFPYLTYLIEDRICLDHVMGCRNWAMLLIKEISNLEAWKKDMLQRRNLNIPSLSGKAASLEQRLHAGLDSLSEVRSSGTKFNQECDLVTHIYAQSALIYLAVVVSGNSHLLPEIRSSVAKALVILKALPLHLLIRVSWAYCVAGCMADQGEKEEFKQILLGSEKAGYIPGTLWNSLDIMEEFWMLRDNLNVVQTTGKCAWALAMDSLGTKVLLI
jgi:hypothetical protein